MQHKTNTNDIEHDPNTSRQRNHFPLEQIQTPKNLLARSGEEEKKEVEKLFGSWKKATAPKLTYSDPKDVQYSQINFIDTPNAVQSEIALVNLSNLKMTDKEYFAAILANQILGGGGE